MKEKTGDDDDGRLRGTQAIFPTNKLFAGLHNIVWKLQVKFE